MSAPPEHHPARPRRAAAAILLAGFALTSCLLDPNWSRDFDARASNMGTIAQSPDGRSVLFHRGFYYTETIDESDESGPDVGTTCLYSKVGLYRMDIESGGIVKVADKGIDCGADEIDASDLHVIWNGSRVIYEAGGALYVSRDDGSSPLKIDRFHNEPGCSWIAGDCDAGLVLEIYFMSPPGSDDVYYVKHDACTGSCPAGSLWRADLDQPSSKEQVVADLSTYLQRLPDGSGTGGYAVCSVVESASRLQYLLWDPLSQDVLLWYRKELLCRREATDAPESIIYDDIYQLDEASGGLVRSNAGTDQAEAALADPANIGHPELSAAVDRMTRDISCDAWGVRPPGDFQ